jgi:hypothetical protein
MSSDASRDRLTVRARFRRQIGVVSPDGPELNDKESVMTNTTTADRNSRTTFIAAATLCIIGLAGVVTAIVVAAASHHSHALPAHHDSNGSHSAPANHVNPNPPDGPSSSVSTLQRELGQLNYYEGPVNGYMTPQTVQAIDNLQHAAGLPQTGSMNAATDNALMSQLTNGDNQMGGN